MCVINIYISAQLRPDINLSILPVWYGSSLCMEDQWLPLPQRFLVRCDKGDAIALRSLLRAVGASIISSTVLQRHPSPTHSPVPPSFPTLG